jgi:chromosome condensin MukBEF MukE localization factor
MFFFLKKYSDSQMLLKKNILSLVEEKKKISRQKNKYSNSCVDRKKISERNKKP